MYLKIKFYRFLYHPPTRNVLPFCNNKCFGKAAVVYYIYIYIVVLFQMEKDDALTELEILKEKLDKALYSTQKTVEEKESAHKEYEKMLEKYDRYFILYVVLCLLFMSLINF